MPGLGNLDPAVTPLGRVPINDLHDALGRVARLLVFGGHEEGSPLADLPVAQLRCLHAINAHEGEKMQQVADALQVKLPTLSQNVERLVQRGFVERHPDPADRRVVRLRLAPAAQAALVRAQAVRRARIEAASSLLAEDERITVVRALGLLARAAEQAQADGDAGTRPDPTTLPAAPRNSGVHDAEGNTDET